MGFREQVKDGKFEKELTKLLEKHKISESIGFPDKTIAEFITDQMDVLENLVVSSVELFTNSADMGVQQ